MAGGTRSTEISDLLEEIKTRSGLSYESVGHRIHASKSAVHRYCTGVSLPQEFGVIERIGTACGASQAEMVRLHHLWARVVMAADSTPATGEPDQPDGPDAVATPSAVSAVHQRRRRSGGHWRRIASLAATCLIMAVAVSGPPLPESGATARAPRQWVSGPTWALPPAPVPSTLFGVTINSATGAMPGFRVGTVRLWDSGTRWSTLEPQRGEFDWTVLDRLVAGAEQQGLPVLFTFGGTPRWAAPTGPMGPYPDGSTPAPPDDLADWDVLVRAVVERYRGRIAAYELWVLGNDPRFYSGNVETLVDMARRAGTILRTVDPNATIACPGMGRLWQPDGVAVLERFAELGGYDRCDVASVKLYQQSASDPPETMLQLTSKIDQVLHSAGIHPRLWNTGTTYLISLQEALDEATARNYAVRFFLVGLYARNVNLERMYFYSWGGTKIPIVLQAVGGGSTRAALAVEQLQRWLSHAESRSCGHGTAVNLPTNVWQCDITITQPGRTHAAKIRWTDTGTATTTAESGTQSIRRLDGSTTPAQSGDTLTITEEPILIDYDR
jgi:hypothetical protein